MTSRERILSDIQQNRPDNLPLPEPMIATTTVGEHVAFTKTVESVGGKVMLIKSIESLQQSVLEIHGGNKRVVNNIASQDWSHADDLGTQSAEELEKIDVAIVEGQIGVAENGAIWVDGDTLGHRALPFICQDLIITLPINKIVANMHQAYSLINVSGLGFGVFISGPSKTADIEQSLVIGAHGARTLTVFLLES